MSSGTDPGASAQAKVDLERAAQLAGHESLFRRLLERMLPRQRQTRRAKRLEDMHASQQSFRDISKWTGIDGQSPPGG